MKTNMTILTLFLTLFVQLGMTQDTESFFTKADAFFGKHVKNGLVDYKAIKENPSELHSILELAKDISVSKSDSKTYQAFWINGYNLYVIKGIVDNYPVKSPLDINGFFDKTKREIGGKQITLNDIENKLLRANFPREARFHFVLVCAGLGCPPIINEAYTLDSLESQLQRQTELALNNPDFIKVKGNKVQLSQIFEWYKSDFTQGGKSEVEFINQYRTEKIDSDVKVGYYAYDWTLNATK
ncbi:DUF547 domain-containing protein [Allomuricauda sp. d1]|uniref:DUF547 domain-containing protein n=1 Tax=Allomuricauda sp. d1 TaxID=3136725 RepID=UPI0031CECDFE